jgi:hypothetical protein
VHASRNAISARRLCAMAGRLSANAAAVWRER